MHTPIKTWLGLTIITILALSAGMFIWYQQKNLAADSQTEIIKPGTKQKACTEEAKLCPDGTAVGRTGQNCEFTLCLEENNTSDLVPSDIEGWQTYRNEEAGVEFKYPESLGKIQVWKKDFTNERENNFSGKAIMAPFIKPVSESKTTGYSSSIAAYFGAYTSDFRGLGFFNLPPEVSCSRPNTYDDKGNFCKYINLPFNNSVFRNMFLEGSCAAQFYTSVSFENVTNSEYRKIIFALPLDGINEKITEWYDCTNDSNMRRSYTEAVAQSKNIVNETSLTEKDRNELETFNQILSTFKFTD